MRKRKQLLSRKRRTVRYVLLLVLVVLSVSLAGFYTFLPGQAARDNADRQGIEKARAAARTRGSEVSSYWGRWVYLMEGERALMLCPVRFDLLAGGWNGGIWSVAETWDGSGFYTGILQHEETGVSYVFGRVDDPAVTSLDLAVTLKDGTVWEQEFIPAWREETGVRYFIEEVEGVPLEESGRMQYRLTAVGGGGQSALIDPACWH